MITKVEMPVGTILQVQNQKVKCTEVDHKNCKDCIFIIDNLSCDIKDMTGDELYFACDDYDRSDKKNVIFKPVEEE